MNNKEIAFKLRTLIKGIKYLDSEDLGKLMEIVFDLDPDMSLQRQKQLDEAEELRRRGYIKPKIK